ncbi:putative ADH1-alcohol dehydrogenase I [Microstroma glucosiphilum]|uniref:alcohol dehydrogenase n=1 Tax=Pseudomicrostroma glucosiphilum TaxID=1684307 RepID=A0A316UB69_9BASI|nr:putative ADH1-alcohol dehydrogenase I [Pseudomicrostroma glucosiphilum]PWN22467.1 putative ADH1-alcohol dehydrogenase I [Pseudomicrostroma glucosiphilum]
MSHKDPRETELSVPKQHKAAIVQKEGGEVKVIDVDTPQKLERGQVLVKVLFSGICHTDLHAQIGDWPAHATFPLCGGHEGAGVVVALGEGADQFVKKGDRVGIKWLADSCLTCDFCRHGNEPNCQAAKMHGFTEHGSFQQYAVSFARHVTPIPDGLSLEAAAPLLCAGVTVWKAVKTANLTPGQTVAIVGAGGGLGHLAVQYAKAAGLRVISIDTGDDKQLLTQQLGSDHFVDFATEKDLVAAVKAKTSDGLGPHAAIVAASGAKAYEQALDYIRPTGALVPVGLPPNAACKYDIFFGVFFTKRILPSYVGNRQDAIESLQFAADGKVKVIYKARGLTELASIYDDMHHGKIAGRIVVDNSK